ncbi:histidine phosphatase family protein [Nocardioides pakistanensis]
MTPRLFLVRHGRSTMDRDRPPHEWGLDPAGLAAIDDLRDSGRLPGLAAWFSSAEPKALQTARRLTDAEVVVEPALGEHERHTTHWFADPADFRAAVRRAFDRPEEPAVSGWEPLSATRDRVIPAVRRILDEHAGSDVVLVGHGTAWTLLVAELTAQEPDLEAWARLRMPDLWMLGR